MVRARPPAPCRDLSCRWLVRLVGVLSAEQLRCLVLCMFGSHLCLGHDVTSFTHQVLIDRYVIASAGSRCHSSVPSAVVLVLA